MSNVKVYNERAAFAAAVARNNAAVKVIEKKGAFVKVGAFINSTLVAIFMGYAS